MFSSHERKPVHQADTVLLSLSKTPCGKDVVFDWPVYLELICVLKVLLPRFATIIPAVLL
eukprot:m.33776 g.33776  ORF g.33776 m.33776 type:complete len:60 (-) comp12257_c0_seq6:69-248(-)